MLINLDFTAPLPLYRQLRQHGRVIYVGSIVLIKGALKGMGEAQP